MIPSPGRRAGGLARAVESLGQARLPTERGYSLAPVVVRLPGRHARAERQQRLALHTFVLRNLTPFTVSYPRHDAVDRTLGPHVTTGWKRRAGDEYVSWSCITMS